MRRVGIAGLQAQQERQNALNQAGDQLNTELTASMRQQMAAFQTNLETFAIKHKKDIQTNADFRQNFHIMCSYAGVDPLTSTKGIWSEVLGHGDFYYELAIRASEVCIRTRVINGGLISVPELLQILKKRRFTYTEDISEDDIERAMKKLSVLQGGFDIIKLSGKDGKGKHSVIKSMPMELSQDHTTVLEVASGDYDGSANNNNNAAPGGVGYVTCKDIEKKLGWNRERSMNAINFLLEKGLCWIDMQAKEPTYWFMGLVRGSSS
mmetsp:Transcript_7352/g.13113  ORF Transcript_7352/g.13113 Transcript_7352/m.13113 type:complete len:265 (-) Transcript_7352:351-1145(-)|eukprot:CAMPEP_0184696542 /NCGR_PEP_ID=MMETSP0313-20130426/3787_1 /TAXON_ID=2792 /ORGANISM="Porphyridium aerugineum, Strain SAG 1380-2" /LENGTH=264 /DNA_ID=CAMNT_0027155175 /DNA_START=36 /DNA_END=830 /DNA_ORIENTATION=-